VSWRDIVAVYERVLRQDIDLRFVPLGAPLAGVPDFLSGFMNALETYGNVIPMDNVSRECGITQCRSKPVFGGPSEWYMECSAPE
jgi:hypothetical protein